MPNPLAVVFAGTPEFALPSLQAVLDAGHDVVAVYTQPDRPSGRGRRLAASPVKQLAQERGLEIRQPRSLKPEAELAALEALKPDLMVVAAYGLLLPRRVLAAPSLGCVNVHASLLPRWRGAAPIQRALLAGDAETGVTIMEMEPGLDTGPMLLKRSCPVGSRDTAGDLHDRLAVLGAEALAAALPRITERSLRAEPQDEALATYAQKVAKEEALIDWSAPAAHIDRQIRAFNPWPVAYTYREGEPLRLWSAEPLEGPADAPPGTVTAQGRDGIEVAAGRGRLRILELQLPGRRAMRAAEFLNAHDLSGVVLG